MPDVVLDRDSLAEDGTDLSTVETNMTTGNTYYYDNDDGKPVIYLRATGAVSVTIETPFSAVGENLPDKTIAMVLDDALVLKPRTRKYYNQPSGTHAGRVKITVDANNAYIAILVP